MKKLIQGRLLPIILSLLLLVGLVQPAYAVSGNGLSFSQIDKLSQSLLYRGAAEEESTPDYAPDDRVRVSIVLKAPSVLAAGFSTLGISAANRFVPDGKGGYTDALQTVKMQGVALDAQLLVFKVFGKKGGAYASDYMAAIEDAIVLGCDSVNLSLGTRNPGFSDAGLYQSIMDTLTESDMQATTAIAPAERQAGQV